MSPSSSSPDIDNNGYLDKNDFECLALRNTLIEGRGEFSAEAYGKNQTIMKNLWNEIAELADFNKVNFSLADEGGTEGSQRSSGVWEVRTN